MFFLHPSTIKANLVAKVMQSAHLCVIHLVKQQKSQFSRFKPDFQFLVKSGKIQDGGQDGHHCW